MNVVIYKWNNMKKTKEKLIHKHERTKKNLGNFQENLTKFLLVN